MQINLFKNVFGAFIRGIYPNMAQGQEKIVSRNSGQQHTSQHGQNEMQHNNTNNQRKTKNPFSLSFSFSLSEFAKGFQQ